MGIISNIEEIGRVVYIRKNLLLLLLFSYSTGY